MTTCSSISYPATVNRRLCLQHVSHATSASRQQHDMLDGFGMGIHQLKHIFCSSDLAWALLPATDVAMGSRF